MTYVSLSSILEIERNVRKFVLFELDNYLFGVPVEQVNQVHNFEKYSQIPNTPDYVLGVMNLRGKIVSLIHLRKRLQLGSEVPKEGEGQIIFVEVADQLVGMLVDRVTSLLSIPIERIKEELDLISTKMNMDFLKGAASLDEGLIVLLNLKGLIVLLISEYEIKETFQHREKLEKALKEEKQVFIPEEELIKLNLEDDFDSSSEGENKGEKTKKSKRSGKIPETPTKKVTTAIKDVKEKSKKETDVKKKKR